MAGPATGKIVDLSDQPIVIGRSPDVGMSLPQDTALSRQHASFTLVGNRVLVKDLGSKHGVFINGTRTAEAHVGDGARVQVGDSVVRVEVFDPLAMTEIGFASAAPVLTGGGPAHEPIVPPPGFEVVRELGSGAMGTVYLARETATGELRAIKQILPKVAMSPEAKKLFLREAAVQSQLDHGNIVRTYGMLEPSPGTFAMVMEFVDGTSAEDLLAGSNTATPAQAVSIGCQALAGLAYAHAKGFVHRDIKEGNLMLANTGAALPTVKVADFGLAKNFHESGASGMTMEGALGGTIPYMPYEQLVDFKYVKPPADLYALGATLYRLLSGEYPRDYRPGENWILVSIEKPVVPLAKRRLGASVPPALCAVIDKALQPELAKRYKNADEMLSDLRKVQA